MIPWLKSLLFSKAAAKATLRAGLAAIGVFVAANPDIVQDPALILEPKRAIGALLVGGAMMVRSTMFGDDRAGAK